MFTLGTISRIRYISNVFSLRMRTRQLTKKIINKMKRQFLILAAAFIFLSAFAAVQIFPTTMKLTVRDELGNTVQGAEVQLYGSDEDYRNEENPVTEKMATDKKGDVKFKDLEPKVYYVLAQKGDKNNWGAGVQTDTLQAGKMNKVTIIIE